MQPTVQRMSQIWESAPRTVTAVSIKIVLSVCRATLPICRNTDYGGQMPRTDENGRQLKALLDYLLDGEIDAKDLFDALGISSSTYYRRIKEADYPSAEELRLVADRFQLNYPDLQIQFGLMSRQEVWQYIESTAAVDGPGRGIDTAVRAGNTTETRRRPKLSELTPRFDAPPL